MREKLMGKHYYKWLVMSITAVGTFMATLDGSIVNVALPTIAKQFRVELDTLQWVVTAYLLGLSALLLIFGRLGDMAGRSRIYNLGFLGFVTGSALCSLAGNNGQLVAFRIIQAVGAAMLFANGTALLTTVFPREERGKALGIMGSVVAAGSLTGPAVGGFLVFHFGWPSIFYINIPLGLAGFIAGLLILPKEKELKKQKFDFSGAFLFTISMGLFLFGITQGGRLGWSSPLILISLGAAMVTGLIFIFLEKKSGEPMVDLSLFGNRLFSAGTAAGFLSFVAIFFIFIHMPFYLQNVMHLTPNKVGLMMIPFPLAMAVASPLSGWLSDRIGYVYLTTGGLAINALGLLSFTTITEQTPIAGIVVRLFSLGLGMGLFQTPNNSSILGTVPPPKYGITSGIIATMRNTGMVIGTALGVAVLTGRQASLLSWIDNPTSTQTAKAFLTALKTNFLIAAVITAFGIVISMVRGKDKDTGPKGKGGPDRSNVQGEQGEDVNASPKTLKAEPIVQSAREPKGAPKEALWERLQRKHYYKWLVLCNNALAVFMAQIDGGIINVALPTLAREFGVELVNLQWVVTAYLLTVSALLVIFGRLGDMIGKSRIYNLGFLGFILGSILCSMAQTNTQLVLFRVIQAVGGAMLLANGVGLSTAVFPREERGKALGIMGAVNAAGSIAGPALGGILIYNFGWHSVFYINIPIGLAGFVASWLVLPREKEIKKQNFDFGGAFLYALTMVLFLYGLTQGSKTGWTNLPILLSLGLAPVAATLFFVVEKKVPQPMLDLSLFKNRFFSASAAAAFLSFVAKFTVAIHMPFYLYNVLHLPADKIGLTMMAVPLALLLVAPISGRLSDRIGSVYLTAGGLAVNTIAVLSLTTLTEHTSQMGVFLRLLVFGIGTGLFQSPNNSSIMGSVSRRRYGIAGGIMQTMRNLGMVMGTALGVAVLTAGQRHYLGWIDNPTSYMMAKTFMTVIKANFLIAAGVNIIGIGACLIRGNPEMQQEEAGPIGRGGRGEAGKIFLRNFNSR